MYCEPFQYAACSAVFIEAAAATKRVRSSFLFSTSASRPMHSLVRMK